MDWIDGLDHILSILIYSSTSTWLLYTIPNWCRHQSMIFLMGSSTFKFSVFWFQSDIICLQLRQFRFHPSCGMITVCAIMVSTSQLLRSSFPHPPSIGYWFLNERYWSGVSLDASLILLINQMIRCITVIQFSFIQ